MLKLFVFKLCSHLFCIHANLYTCIRMYQVLLNYTGHSYNILKYSNWLNWLHFWLNKILLQLLNNKTIWENDNTNFWIVQKLRHAFMIFLQNAIREFCTLCCCLNSPRKDTSLYTQRRDAFHLPYDEAKYELKTLSLSISDV